MLCPQDNVACDPVLLQDVEVDVCPKCQGVWLEQTEVRKLVRYFQIPEYSDVDELLAKWDVAMHAGTPPKDFWIEDKLICPKEGAQMQKHYFAGSSIGVDHCLVCKGFWLDGGELQAIMEETAPNPALEKAGAALLREWNSGLARERRAAETLNNFVLSSTAMVANPAAAIWLVGNIIVRYVIDLIARKDGVR